MTTIDFESWSLGDPITFGSGEVPPISTDISPAVVSSFLGSKVAACPTGNWQTGRSFGVECLPGETITVSWNVYLDSSNSSGDTIVANLFQLLQTGNTTSDGYANMWAAQLLVDTATTDGLAFWAYDNVALTSPLGPTKAEVSDRWLSCTATVTVSATAVTIAGFDVSDGATLLYSLPAPRVITYSAVSDYTSVGFTPEHTFIGWNLSGDMTNLSTFVDNISSTSGGGGGPAPAGATQMALHVNPGTLSIGRAVAGSSQGLGIEVNGGFLPTPADPDLIIIDPALDQAPTFLRASVGGAVPGESVVFSIDGVAVWTEAADSSGSITVTSIPVGTQSAGTHTLTAVAHGVTLSGAFTIALEPLVVTDPDDSEDLPTIDPPSGKWVFSDPRTLGDWVLPINPSAMTSPHRERSVTVNHTTLPTGQHHINEGGNNARSWKLQGYCPDRPFYDQLLAYSSLRHRWYVIDHRGRTWRVAAVSVAVEPRKRQSDAVSAENDWAGNWTFELLILE